MIDPLINIMPRRKKEEIKTKEKTKEAKTKAPSYYTAVGRRKTATARVKLQVKGSGKIFVNRKPIEEYFPGEAAKIVYLEPFKVTNNLGRFDVFIKVTGSGLSAAFAGDCVCVV